MRAKEFLRLPLIQKGEWLKAKLDNMNDDGTLIVPDDEFDAWAKDMLDVVLLPFPADHPIEKITDTVIASLGLFDGMKYVRIAAARYVEPIVDFVFMFNPLGNLADKLPD